MTFCLFHLAECCAELSPCVNIQYYRLVSVHSPCQERDDAPVSVCVCLNVCLILPLVFGVTVLWLGYIVQYRAVYPNFLQLCLVCIASIYFNWPHTRHRFYTLIQGSRGPRRHMETFMYSLYDAAVPVVFILSAITISKRKMQGTTVFRCTRPDKWCCTLCVICSQNIKKKR